MSQVSSIVPKIEQLSENLQIIATNNYFKIFLAIVFVICIFMILYLVSINSFNTMNAIYLQLIFVVVFILVLLFLIIRKFSYIKIITYVIAAILFLVLFFTNNSVNSIFFSSYMSIIFIGITAIIALAIIFNIFSNNLRKLHGWQGFIINLIFLIPCLFSDFIKGVFSEFGATPNIVFVLFIIEILVVLGYIYLPQVKQLFLNDNGIELMKQPALLNQHYFLDVNKIPKYTVKVNDITDITTQYSDKTYAISMWIYVNPQPTNYISNKDETPIFTFSGHPLMTYQNDTDDATMHKSDIYRVYFGEYNINPSNNETEKLPPITLRLLPQRWNFIVFNYYGTGGDVFVNGVLERTQNFEVNLNYTMKDTMEIGYVKKNNRADYGLDGAISNVVYYPNILNTTQIANRYNLTMPKPNHLANYPKYIPKPENITTPL